MEKKNMNNKGFSLVELIIVIAIMAVLIGVLAPQYLKYVEKSRVSSDISSIDELVNAVEIYSADPANSIVSGSITCANGTVTADAGTLPALQDAGLAASTANAGDTILTTRSNAYKNWTITFSSTGISFSTGDGGDALKAALGRN